MGVYSTTIHYWHAYNVTLSAINTITNTMATPLFGTPIITIITRITKQLLTVAIY